MKLGKLFWASTHLTVSSRNGLRLNFTQTEEKVGITPLNNKVTDNEVIP